METDEEIYYKYISGQETRSKENILNMMGAVRVEERKKHMSALKDARTCILASETSKSKCTLCPNTYCPLNEVHKQ